MDQERVQMFNDFMTEFDNVKELLKLMVKEQNDSNELLKDILQELEK